MAVTQLLKIRFRMVNCWFPMEAPTIPPLNVMSVMNPAEPKICQRKGLKTTEPELTAFTKESSVLCARGGTHLENDILQAGSLSRWPMDARSLTRSRNTRKIKDEISHLSEEDIG